MSRLVQIERSGSRSLAGAFAPSLPEPARAARRPARAEPTVTLRPAGFADVPAMADLINAYATHGLMLPKTPTQLYRGLREFVIASDGEGRLLGCGALRIYDAGLAEVCSLAVADAARGLGVGRTVVEALHEEAVSFGLPRTFALTLEPGFFHKLGYVTVDRAVLPQKIEADCVGCPRRHACNEIAVVRTLAPS
ncbi:MAG TPA: GNAT family N-acetyltransferase [Longimicrobiales bacterium]|nr:GNAT family N-acetyltransferase [Longimicrobiales bacterium]